MLKHLLDYNIILGSKSPRRRELLQMLKIPFSTVVIEGLKEEYPEDMPKMSVPQYLSEIKANEYLKHLKDKDLVITADTLVIIGERVFGKPKTHSEAIDMLLELSGKTHNVVTGVTVATQTKRISFTSVTEVHFVELSEEESKYYVDTFSPLDKAGAYGIQEWIGGVAVDRISGSFYNVMGLPVHQLYRELKNF